VLVALLMMYLLLRSGVQSYAAVVPATAALAYVVMASGRLSLAAAGVRGGGPLAAWTLGLLVTCLAVYALTAALTLTAATAFGAVAAIVVAMELAVARRLREPSVDWRVLGGLALCVGFTAAWCSAPANAYEVLHAQGVLPVWSDYFFHGGLISQFGDVRAAGHQSIYLAGFPSSFYHFASYAAAAALAGMLDQPGLPLATAAWMPLGFLAMSTGAYALGERLAGAAGGIASLAAIVILPDASNYGLRNGLFSFHWTVLATPGATYALGAAFLSLTLLDRWSIERSAGALAASLLIAASIVLFRAHIFLLFLPAWFATAALCSVPPGIGKGRIVVWLMTALLATAIAGSLTLAHLASTNPGVWRFAGGAALQIFLNGVHTGQEPTAYTGIYADLASRTPPLFSLTAGIVLAFVAALGAFLVLLPAALALAGRRGALRPVDAFPGLLAFCWLLLMLFAPIPWHGEPTDLIHRPFVLLYSAAAVWTLCLVLRCLAARGGQVASRLWRTVLAGALLGLPAIVSSADGMARPKFRWGEKDAAPRVEPGLLAAAAFLREHAASGDIFAAAGLNGAYETFDFSTKLCALSGMPAYLARPHMEMIKDAERKAIAGARLVALNQVDRETSYEAAMESLRGLNVKWYVVAEGHAPAWHSKDARATFSAGEIAVYATR
jgi:hypothetical protein